MYEVIMSMSCVFYVLMDFVRTELLTELYETTPTENPHYGKLNSSPVFTSCIHTGLFLNSVQFFFLSISSEHAKKNLKTQKLLHFTLL